MSRLSALLPERLRSALRSGRERLLLRSLRAAVREQGLGEWVARHEAAVPDLSDQYSDFSLDTEFLRFKVRAQQAFQVSLAAPVLAENPGGAVVDIGDSSGAHTAALKAALPGSSHRFFSVNLDPAAVERVRARGFAAELCRAEELPSRGIEADTFLCFETLEHLSDPGSFLNALSKTPCRRLVLTVPLVSATRVGLHHVRAGLRRPVSPETVHIFEFSPGDLKLLARHAGWEVVVERAYRQYPQRSALRATRRIWRSWDFEGFYGLVLRRDPSWSSLYSGWS